MTTKHKKGTNKGMRERILRHVLEGDSEQAIIKATGLSRASVRGYTEAPDFKEEVERLRANRRDSLLNRLEYAGQVAIATLVRQASAGTPAGPRQGDKGAVMAADSILDRIGLHRTVASKVEAKTTNANTNTDVPHEFADRTEDELRYYANNGHWPEEAAR